MNLAFQAVVFLALILPGLLFRKFYNGKIGVNTIFPQSYPTLSGEFILIIIAAILLDSLWVVSADFVCRLYDTRVNLEACIILLAGDYNDKTAYHNAVTAVADFPVSVFSFFTLLYIVSGGLGELFHRWVRHKKWDINYKFFRFNNNWYYLFSGEILQFPENDSHPKNVSIRSISAVVEVGGQSHLYVGILEEVYFKSDGTLDRLLLKYVFRRTLDNDLKANNKDPSKKPVKEPISKDSRFYRVEGDYLVLDSKDIKTINVKYTEVHKQTNPTKAAPPPVNSP